jgi:hypothetical protein
MSANGDAAGRSSPGFAIFLTLRDGRIARQHNYDCFGDVPRGDMRPRQETVGNGGSVKVFVKGCNQSAVRRK